MNEKPNISRTLLAATILVLSNLLTGAAPAAADSETLTIQTLTIRTDDYRSDATGLSVPGYGMSRVPGAPTLPIYTALVALPPDGGWQVTYVTADDRVLDARFVLAAVPVESLDEGGEAVDVSGEEGNSLPRLVARDLPDPAIYGTNAFYPAKLVRSGQPVTQRGQRYLPLHVYPFQYNPITGEVLHHPNITVTVSVALAGDALAGEAMAAASDAVEATQPPPDEQGAVRVKTTERGMYALSFDGLQAAGAAAGSILPASFRMTYLGQPVQIQVTGDGDDAFEAGEAVVFFAEQYLGRYAPYNVYRLSWGSTVAPPETRIGSRTVSQGGRQRVVEAVTQVTHVEVDNTYQFAPYAGALAKSARLPASDDHFFDALMNAKTTAPSAVRNYSVTVDDAVLSGSRTATVSARVYNARGQTASPDASFELKLNSTILGTFQWEGEGIYTATTTVAADKLLASGNQVALTAALAQLSGVSDYTILPDWVEVSYPALPDAEGDRIYIRGIDTTGTTAVVPVTGFSSGAVRAYDVRNPRQPVELLSKQATQQGSTYEVRFWDAWANGAPAAQYWASTEAALLAPLAVELDAPSTWKSTGINADYIALVHRDLWDAVQPLLDLRAGQGLRVAKVDVADVYDEFGYGRLDPEAIRSFLSYAYHNWNQGGPRPQYVVLVGDGHYDFKGVTGTAQKMYIPPYFTNSDYWLNETPADDRYASVDGATDQLADMAIGRIPANSAADVTNVYNKIVAYEDPAVATPGDWQKRAVFAADNDQDSNGNFHLMSEYARAFLPSPAFESRLVYYDPTTPSTLPAPLTSAAAVKSAMYAAFNDSAILVQWFGHANPVRWGSVSGIFNILDPAALQPNARLPFSQVYACQAGAFAKVAVVAGSAQSVGETLVLTSGRGSIADLSSSALQITSELKLLNERLIKSVFVDRIAEIGKAVQAAKLRVVTEDLGSYPALIDGMILFGDPAVKLRLPTDDQSVEVKIGPSGTNAFEIGWEHVANSTNYEVRRSENPYFDPSDGNIVGEVDASGYVPGMALQVVDDGGTPSPGLDLTGDPTHNYFWMVRGKNGTAHQDSANRTGKFEFSLTTGG